MHAPHACRDSNGCMLTLLGPGLQPPAPSPAPIADKCELLLVGECTASKAQGEREWCARAAACCCRARLPLRVAERHSLSATRRR